MYLTFVHLSTLVPLMLHFMRIPPLSSVSTGALLFSFFLTHVRTHLFGRVRANLALALLDEIRTRVSTGDARDSSNVYVSVKYSHICVYAYVYNILILWLQWLVALAFIQHCKRNDAICTYYRGDGQTRQSFVDFWSRLCIKMSTVLI